MINALGVDVEEWYHLCGIGMPTGLDDAYESRIVENTECMLKLLDSLQTKATFFVLGVIAERFPALVEAIDHSGHEIGSHSYQHCEIFRHTRESFREDVRKAKDILENIIKKPVVGYRAPDFSITEKTQWAIDILAEEGMRYDCSIFPICHRRYGMPSASRFHYRLRQELIEFPPSTIRLFGNNIPVAGGGYTRIFPYWFIKNAVQTVNSEGAAFNSYVHVWEIDVAQPKLHLPFKRYWAHYIGLEHVERKLLRLLTDFDYAPIQKVITDGKY